MTDLKDKLKEESGQKRVIFRFCLYGFLKNQRYFEPFILLAFLEKGLSFFVIGLLFGFRELCINLFEIPSGGTCGPSRPAKDHDTFLRSVHRIIHTLCDKCANMAAFSCYVLFLDRRRVQNRNA